MDLKKSTVSLYLKSACGLPQYNLSWRDSKTGNLIQNITPLSPRPNTEDNSPVNVWVIYSVGHFLFFHCYHRILLHSNVYTTHLVSMPKEPTVSQSRRSRNSAGRVPNGQSNASTMHHATGEASSSKTAKREKQQQKPRPYERERSDAHQWPLQYFPPPPDDGHWMTTSGGKPANKIPPKPTGLPPPPSATFHPPLMPLAYPPPPPLREDPTWLPQMVGDVQRQRSHVEMQLALAQAEATSALVEATLAHADLEKETGLMQTFLNHVAHIAGSGFVRRLLSDVEDVITCRLHPDDEQGSADDGSSHGEEEEIEAVVTEDESGDDDEDGQSAHEKGEGRTEGEERGGAEEVAAVAVEEEEEQGPTRFVNGSPPPGVETNPLAVGRRRGRPLRRDPYRLREDDFGEPVLYTVVE